MASRRTRPSPELVDDTIIDVLLRLPPEQPALLVRASLVCKQWRRVVSDPAFLLLYARVHRTPPLLGFFHHLNDARTPCFVPIPTTAAAAAAGKEALAIDHDHCRWLVLDCRHGRVLLQRRYVHAADDDTYARAFLVWDPVSGDRHELPWPNAAASWSAVVLCAAAADGCDHSGCRGGPFLVLCADVGLHRPTGTGSGWSARARVYSSQLRAWGAPAHLDLHGYEHFFRSRAVVIGEQVYLFRLYLADQIVRYDLRRHCLSAIESPGFCSRDTGVELMATDEGLLGLACARRSRVHLWSRTANDDAAGWEQSRVIDLRTMTMMISSSPAAAAAAGGAGRNDDDNIIKGANVLGFAEGANVIFVGTNAGTLVVHLKSGRAKKVCDAWIHNPVVPLMAF